MSMTVAQIMQTSWFPQVNAIMNNAGVPTSDWLGVVMAESGGNPTAVGPEAGGNASYGLFQLYDNSQGLDPTYAAQWAAPKLAAAYQAAGGASATPSQIVQQNELAAWPGTDAKLDAQEFPQRLASLQSVMNQLPNSNVQSTSITTGPLTPTTTSTATPPTPASGGLVGLLTGGFSTMVTSIEQNVFIGGLILALVAGAFALLSSGD